MGLRISNIQIGMLHDLLERELAADPNQPEWIELLARLNRMQAWRERQEILRDGPKPKVWGKDYV